MPQFGETEFGGDRFRREERPWELRETRLGDDCTLQKMHAYQALQWDENLQWDDSDNERWQRRGEREEMIFFDQVVIFVLFLKFRDVT